MHKRVNSIHHLFMVWLIYFREKLNTQIFSKFINYCNLPFILKYLTTFSLFSAVNGDYFAYLSCAINTIKKYFVTCCQLKITAKLRNAQVTTNRGSACKPTLPEDMWCQSEATLPPYGRRRNGLSTREYPRPPCVGESLEKEWRLSGSKLNARARWSTKAHVDCNK